MPGPPRRYSIQISDADGASLLSVKTCWTEKERRTAFAQIERLAGLPEVNVYTGPPALEPQSARRTTLIGGVLALLAIPFALAAQSGVGATKPGSTAAGWELERDVEAPSYAVIEPASTDLNIDSLVLSCEQGPHRRGLQLRLYLSGGGALAPRGAGDVAGDLKDDPTVEFAIDGVSHAAQLLFADDFVVVADSADGVMPLLSSALLDALQAGRRMELRFQLVQGAQGQTPTVDGTAVIDLQAGPGGTAVAAVRRCVGDSQIAEKAGRAR